jgi:hypothetical protein
LTLGKMFPDGDRLGDLRLVINALLYITGSDDIVSQIVPRRAGRRHSPVDGGGHRARCKAAAATRRTVDLAAVQVHDVGAIYASAIRRYIRDLEHDAGAEGSDAGVVSSSGRSVRPHIRAPHSHLYWTGPGRTVPRVRFIAPVFVRGGVPEGSEVSGPRLRAVS